MDDLVFLNTPEGMTRLEQSEAKTHFSYYQPFYNALVAVDNQTPASVLLVLNTLNMETPLENRAFCSPDGLTQDSVTNNQAIQQQSMDMEKLAMAITRDWPVIVERYAANSLDLEGGRALLLHALRSKGRRVVVNYDSASFGLTVRKAGCFSVLAAYERTVDQFLVMGSVGNEAAPFWVSTEQLFEAMMTLDDTASCMRGCLIISTR